MLSQTLLFCGDMPASQSGMTAWAQCNFTALVMLVVATLGVLFIIALLQLVSIGRHRNRPL